MEQTLLLNRLSIKKLQRKICCKPIYQMRKLKNKGAVVVIVWNFLVASVYNYLISSIVPNGSELTAVALGLTLPFAGWLADIQLGRYKVIRWSIWIMWIASMLITISSVVGQLVPGHHNTFKFIFQILAFVLAIGFGGYQANIIQFGLDQLQDASTTEITAFIIWYVWTYFSNGALFQFAYVCVKPDYNIFGQLIVSMSLTVVISSSYFVDYLLINEPVTQNPFKLIYHVIRYAIKNKHPQFRSAFTYCEDELPSRIDFGKSKYGGPFTVEQVEDVKTFLRLLVILLIGSVLTGEILAVHESYNKPIKKLQHTKSTISFIECYNERFITSVCGYIPTALFIPLHEFILRPLFHKLLPSIKTYMLLQTVRIITYMTIDATSRKTYSGVHGYNITVTCNHHGSLSWSSYRYWMAISILLETICITMLSISSIEFLASQTPYSMRGLMIGAGYGSVFIFAMIGYAVYWAFTQSMTSTWGTEIISCEFWYLLSMLIVLIIFSGVLIAVGRWYKNRKREDVLPNEYIFAERYYSQIN